MLSVFINYDSELMVLKSITANIFDLFLFLAFRTLRKRAMFNRKVNGVHKATVMDSVCIDSVCKCFFCINKFNNIFCISTNDPHAIRFFMALFGAKLNILKIEFLSHY